MKIKFVEDIDLALRKRLDGRVACRRRFKPGDKLCAEDIGNQSIIHPRRMPKNNITIPSVRMSNPVR
jgi:hypothetical protein